MKQNDYPIPGQQEWQSGEIDRTTEEMQRVAGALELHQGETLIDAALRCTRERDESIAERAELETALGEEIGKRDAFAAEVGSLKRELAHTKSDLASAQGELRALRKGTAGACPERADYTQLRDEVAQLQATIEAKAERIRELEKTIHELNIANNGKNQAIDSLRLQVSELANDGLETSAECRDLQSKLSDALRKVYNLRLSRLQIAEVLQNVCLDVVHLQDHDEEVG